MSFLVLQLFFISFQEYYKVNILREQIIKENLYLIICFGTIYLNTNVANCWKHILRENAAIRNIFIYIFGSETRYPLSLHILLTLSADSES